MSIKPILLLAAGSMILVSACKKADETAPEITINGGDVVQLLGSVYTDQGATASDDRDGDLTSFMETVNDVNTARTGTYHVTYKVSDFAGNETSVYRTVVILNQADSFAGTYSVKDSIWGGAVTNYTEQISASTITNNRLITNKFGNLINATVYMDLVNSNTQVTVPSQGVNCGSPSSLKTFSTPGNGAVGGNPLTITFSYQYVDGSTTTSATATYTKQ